jgi:hypothetical protein
LGLELTPAAQRLLAGHVDSVGALDLLLLLHATRDRVWTADALCARLRCPEPWVQVQLGRLAAAGLVTRTESGLRYRRGARFGAAVDELARVTRQDRAAVVRLIFAQPPGQLAR